MNIFYGFLSLRKVAVVSKIKGNSAWLRGAMDAGVGGAAWGGAESEEMAMGAMVGGDRETGRQQELSRSWVLGSSWGVPGDQDRRQGYGPGMVGLYVPRRVWG